MTVTSGLRMWRSISLAIVGSVPSHQVGEKVRSAARSCRLSTRELGGMPGDKSSFGETDQFDRFGGNGYCPVFLSLYED